MERDAEAVRENRRTRIREQLGRKNLDTDGKYKGREEKQMTADLFTTCLVV